MTDTLGGVVQPRGWVSDADRERILAARAADAAAQDAASAARDEYRAAVLAATAHGASVRELAALTGLSAPTIQAWRSQA
ncbi:MAG: hypothetical protein Tp182DCM212571_43 [Prokaryotic dsDNA virus sp.]|nr:MAG: hypothetical protein Tp182DCM212571_43 [Prokaryotic dsDNA virus sp.]RCL84557.1 MAG: helix-turn-helix domain-containing protein [Microbacterium sp.]